MGRRIGIIAGSGAIPRLVLEDVRGRGWSAAVAALPGEADPGLAGLADAFAWIDPRDIGRFAAFFREARAGTIFLLGKLDPRMALEEADAEGEVRELLARAGGRTPGALLRAVIDELSGRGLDVGDPRLFFEPYQCAAGVLTRTVPAPAVEADIAFGWPLARMIADGEIGQTLVVKGGTVVAVEGLEGTDRAIVRGGRLAGPGTVVLKAGRRRQDPRIDLPAVGLETVRSLIEARAAALCIEAAVVPFFQREEALALADASGIAVLARPA